MVFVYSGAIDHKGYGGLVKSMQPSDEQPHRPNAIMFLTTFGGHADQAYRIARLLQNTTDTFYLCLPAECKSAGTLITLGANELFMTPVSELGPLDVQLRQRDEIGQRRLGMTVRTALEGLSDETFKVFENAMLKITLSSYQAIGFDVASRVASTIATGVMAPVYAQIDPEKLGADLRDLSVATAYGTRLIEHGGNATRGAVRQLVEDYPTHGFIIDNAEADTLFETVKGPTEEMHKLMFSLGEVVYVAQSPHVVGRLDGHSPEDGNDRAAKRSPEGSSPTDVDRRRKAPRRSNRKRERAVAGAPGKTAGDGDDGGKS